MPEAMRIELTPEARAILAKLRNTGEMMGQIASETNTQNQLTVDWIAERRLSGKGPFPVEEHRLGERTHNLRQSLRRSEATISGNAVESAIGTHIIYARAHEFGVDEEVTVTPHARKRFETREFIGAEGKSGRRKTVRKRVRVADTMVGVGKRHMKLPARAPITTGVTERMDALGLAVSSRIVRAWRLGEGAA